MNKTLDMLKRIAQGRPANEIEPLQREDYEDISSDEIEEQGDDIEIVEAFDDVEVPQRAEAVQVSEKKEISQEVEVARDSRVSRLQSVVTRAYEEKPQEATDGPKGESIPTLLERLKQAATQEQRLEAQVAESQGNDTSREEVPDKLSAETIQTPQDENELVLENPLEEDDSVRTEEEPSAEEKALPIDPYDLTEEEGEEYVLSIQSEKELQSDPQETEGRIHSEEIPPKSENALVKANAGVMQEEGEAGEDERLKAGEPNVARLINGDLLPMTSFHLRYVDNFQLMNEAIVRGEVRLVLRRGNPHVALTPQAVDKLIHKKVHEADALRKQLESIDRERERTIEELSERLNQIQSMKLLRDETKKTISGEDL